MRRWSAILCLGAILAPAAATANSDHGNADPWAVSVYTGPFTTKYLGAIVQSFNMHPTAAYVGAAIDRHLIYLGWGTWIAADGEIGQTWFGHHDTTYGFGLGFQINGIFGFRHSTLSVYDGPSWDTSPSRLEIGYKEKVYPNQGARFLNYIVIEDAIALTRDGKWDGVIRMFHRSGMFGVFSLADTEGTVIGLGVRYRF